MVGQVGNFLQKCTKIGFYFPLQEVQNKTEHQLSVYFSNFQQTVLFFISSLVLATSAYLKVVRTHMPGCCFCFSNLHRFTVFAFVKRLNCFAICSVLTEAFSLCILLKEEKAREGIFIFIFFVLLTKISMKDYNQKIDI